MPDDLIAALADNVPPTLFDSLENGLWRVTLTACVAALLFYLVSVIITRLMCRVDTDTFVHALARRSVGPIRLLLPLIALQLVWRSAPDEIVMIAGLRHITSVLIIACFTWLALRAVAAIEDHVVARNPVDMADNLQARKIQTQTKVLIRSLGVLVLLIGVAAILTTFPSVRQFGTSLLASAGLAGLVVGFAARPVLGNLIAGIQIAITQPIRLDDVVIIENEWGRIEEITGTYVVVRIWDNRRLIVPLQWIIENPFQNWTRHTSSILGTVFFWVDYSVPVSAIREEVERLCRQVPQLWDGEVCVVQVTDCSERAMQVRALGSAGDSSRAWDLRCYLRENILSFINVHYPDSLPRIRATMSNEAEVERPEPETSPIAERQPPV